MKERRRNKTELQTKGDETTKEKRNNDGREEKE